MKNLPILASIASIALLLLAGCTAGQQPPEYILSYSLPSAITPYAWEKTLVLYPNATLARVSSRWDRNQTTDSIILTSDEFARVQALIANATASGLSPVYRKPGGPAVGSTGYALNFTMGGAPKRIEVEPGAPVPQALAALTNGLSALERRRMGGLEGEFCGGIAAFPCAQGLSCRLEGQYPDAGGACNIGG